LPNAYRGETSVPGLGTLRYDWDAVAKLIAEFGQDFDANISKSMAKMDLETIAKAVAIGLGITPEEVKRAAPPIVPTINAVMIALNLSFHGKSEAPVATGGNPPKRSAVTSSRKRGSKRSAGG
jgi:hypothetical protein